MKRLLQRSDSVAAAANGAEAARRRPGQMTWSQLSGGSNTEPRELRHFGLLLGILVVIVFVVIPLLRRHVLFRWPLLVAAPLWATALIAPGSLRYLHCGWAWLGKVLGWLNTRVILSLLYFSVVVPIGLIMKLAGRDPMRRKSEPASVTYRLPTTPRRSNHLEQPY